MRAQLVLAAAMAVSSCLASDAHAAAPAATGWQLVWADEFDGPDGSGVDRAKWVPEVGGHGWGNNELQFYRDELANARVENGALVITAIRERFTAGNVTRDSRRGSRRRAPSSRPMAASRRASRCPPARASGRRSGCSATTSAP
jgi:hypothetical protein